MKGIFIIILVLAAIAVGAYYMMRDEAVSYEDDSNLRGSVGADLTGNIEY